MTHPFHPLSGRDFEFVEHKLNWGEDRVWLHDENGRLFSLPAGWIDVVALDLFVVIELIGQDPGDATAAGAWQAVAEAREALRSEAEKFDLLIRPALLEAVGLELGDDE